MEADASVNSRDILGRRALHFAIVARWWYPPIPNLKIACDMWIVERLLCHPEISLNPVDQVGNTPLMWVVKERKSDAVKGLFKKGANANIPNINNRTPLQVALSSRNPSNHIVSALLTNGAGIYCEDKFRQIPMDILVRNVRAHETFLFAKHVW
ncbi:hypothetical protein AVEN_59708-1 [Araneus ventricosus]|uniref:Alpha-latrotoxin n=1 Tax=Araneus ventricosus TaxID=182803 RepID=A0A4Y2BMU2_ARAVE|nr:hypothetical protein AVEN_59708-1 [Araneus ventricosus]